MFSEVFLFVVTLVLLIAAIGFTGYGLFWAVNKDLLRSTPAILGVFFLLGSIGMLDVSNGPQWMPPLVGIYVGLFLAGVVSYVSSAMNRQKETDKDLKRMLGIAGEPSKE